jgi:hypothetical protein
MIRLLQRSVSHSSAVVLGLKRGRGKSKVGERDGDEDGDSRGDRDQVLKSEGKFKSRDGDLRGDEEFPVPVTALSRSLPIQRVIRIVIRAHVIIALSINNYLQ